MYNNPEFKNKIIILEDEELKGAFLKQGFLPVLPCKFTNIKEYDNGLVGEYYVKRKHKIMAYDFQGKKLIPEAEYQSVVILDESVRVITANGEIISYQLKFNNKEKSKV